MRADWIMLMIAAARLRLRSDPAKSQLERLGSHGLIVFSTGLWSIGTAPSSKFEYTMSPNRLVAVSRQPHKDDVGVNAVPQGHAGNRHISSGIPGQPGP